MPEPRNVGAFLFPPGGNSGPNINWAIQQRHRIDSSLFDSGMELRYIFFAAAPLQNQSIFTSLCFISSSNWIKRRLSLYTFLDMILN